MKTIADLQFFSYRKVRNLDDEFKKMRDREKEREFNNVDNNNRNMNHFALYNNTNQDDYEGEMYNFNDKYNKKNFRNKENDRNMEIDNQEEMFLGNNFDNLEKEKEKFKKEIFRASNINNRKNLRRFSSNNIEKEKNDIISEDINSNNDLANIAMKNAQRKKFNLNKINKNKELYNEP